MQTLISLVLVGIALHEAAAVTHSLKYFYTASSGIPNFPEYVSVGLVDDAQISHCDSITNRNVPKQDWMSKVTAEYPQYWDDMTQVCVGNQPSFKADIVTVKQRFNQTGGVHVVQWMVGCEWDDETQEVTGYDQHGYDGEDFIAFDLKTETFIAPSPQAFITKNKWESNKAVAAQKKNYLTQLCPEWVKKYLSYGRSSLMKTVPPTVSFLQKTPSSPVSCHATGFYPNKAVMFWRKNGEELHEDVDQGEILPNHDGSFQKSVELSSVKPEDFGNYECVFQLSGLKDDIVTRLGSRPLITNRNRPGVGGEFPVGAVVGVVAGALILAAVVAGLLVWRKKNEKPKGFTQANTSETSSSSSSREAGEKA